MVALAVAVDSSLGVNGHLYPWFYTHLLPYRGLRVPARFGMLAAMFVSVLAGLGVASVMKRVTSSARCRYAFVAIATVLVIAESLNRPFVLRTMPPNIPAVYEWLREAPAGVVVEYPVGGLEGRIGPQDPTYMYYSTAHWKPLLNGYSGFAPPSYVRTAGADARLPERRVDRILARARGEVPPRSQRVLHQRRVRAGCRGAGAADGRAPRGAVSQRRFGDTDVYELAR